MNLSFSIRTPMRPLLIAAALAAAAAAPAAAQTEADVFAAEVMQRLAANHAGVQDYSFTLVWRSTRLPVYVHQTAEGWQVETPKDGSPAQGLMIAAVLWPMLSSLDQGPDEGSDEDPWSQYLEFGLERDTAQGQPARVLFARRRSPEWGGAALPDSFRMYVDEASRQISRVRMSGGVEEGLGEDTPVQQVDASIDWAAYQTAGGLTLPRRLRVRMRMEMKAGPEERRAMRENLVEAAAELEGDDSPEAQQMRELLELYRAILSGSGMDLQMRMEDVRVNPGPPFWL